MSQPPDDDLRGLFEEARRADEGKAPPFRRVLERGAARRSASPRFGRALAVAAAAVAAIVVVISAPGFRRPRETASGRIETWRPPTDFLLETSSSELFHTIPALPDPPPDYSTLLAKEKGSTS